VVTKKKDIEIVSEGLILAFQGMSTMVTLVRHIYNEITLFR